MSDWAEFCEVNGWNAGSVDDYEQFLDSLEEAPTRRAPPGAPLEERVHFTTFAAAVAWAKSHPGRAITRSVDGTLFVPLTPRRAR